MATKKIIIKNETNSSIVYQITEWDKMKGDLGYKNTLTKIVKDEVHTFDKVETNSMWSSCYFTLQIKEDSVGNRDIASLRFEDIKLVKAAHAEGNIHVALNENNNNEIFIIIYDKYGAAESTYVTASMEGLRTIYTTLQFENKTDSEIKIRPGKFDNIVMVSERVSNINLAQKASSKVFTLENDPHNKKADGFFAYHLTINDKPLADITFWGAKGKNFRLYEIQTHESTSRVDVQCGKREIKVLITNDKLELGKFKYHEIELTHDLKFTNSKGIQTLLDFLSANSSVQDVIFITHGFNTDPIGARNIYNNYFSNFNLREDAFSKTAVCGIVWHSQHTDTDESIVDKIKTGVSFILMEKNAELSGRTLASGINEIKKELDERKIRIHLAGHSLGGLFMLNMVSVLVKHTAKSVFLIQPAADKESANGIEALVDGPLVISYSTSDEQLGWVWFGGHAHNNILEHSDWVKEDNWFDKQLNKVGYGAKTIGKIFETAKDAKKKQFDDGNSVGALGFVGPYNRSSCDMNNNGVYDFPKGKAYGLKVLDLKNHDDYKTIAFAKAHIRIIGLGNS